MKKLSPVLPFIFSILLTLTIFWKLPVKGLVPFPGDLLVGRMFPFNIQDWSDYGFPLGVPYKEFISADTIRQTYPWRKIAIDQLKQGQIPYWNPYAFSGTPLLANLQSAPFYPLNFIYWLLPFNTSWVIQVLLQPILALFFTYLFVRSLKLSHLASFFAGITFAFSGYLTVWLELNTVGHAALWLPLILFSLNYSRQNSYYYWLTVLGITSSIFAGHLQTTFYILIITCLYFFTLNLNFKSKKQPKLAKHTLYFLFTLILTLLITSIQTFPAFELLKLSPRYGSDPQIFNQFLLPPKHLITFLIPNYFGNPATNNFWGSDYGEFMAYFGIIAFVLTLTSLFSKSKSKIEIFFTLTLIGSLIFIIKNPIAQIPLLLKLPILSSSAASRALFITQFSAAILAAFGIEKAIQKIPSTHKAAIVTLTLFTLIITSSLFQWQTATDPLIKTQYKVALRNTVIPFASFLALFTIILANRLFPKQKKFLVNSFKASLIIIPIFGSSIFANKYLPFSHPDFIFPPNPIFTELANRGDYQRFFGDYTSSVSSNIWIPSQIYSSEGYDSLYSNRYGQLIQAAKNNNQLLPKASRSDANLERDQDTPNRQRLQDVLGVSYILDKEDFPKSDWEPDPFKFSEKRYQLIWQQGKYKIYQNLNALPRVTLIPTFFKAESDQQILDTLFDPNWQPHKSVIIEEKPQTPNLTPSTPITMEETPATGSAQIVTYTPSFVQITTQTDLPQFLFLSDGYYPNWSAYIDDQPTKIYRANFAFRAVIVPTGTHIITFKYE